MLLTLALLAPLHQNPTVDPQAVNAAIDRGSEYLVGLLSDKKRAKRMRTERAGLRALIAYTLLKSGVEPDHAAVGQLLEQLSTETIEGTYDLACLMLTLQAHDPLLHRPWMEELCQQMIGWQKDGEWDYPGGAYDLSNTQYAALGLWSAERCGVEVAPEVWQSLTTALLDYQDEEGAFSYTRPGKAGYGSMTAAGVGTLALCEMYLGEGGLDAERRKEIVNARTRGLDWLTANFSIETNPRNGGWHYYYLYGLERMGGLAGAPLLGEHDWYAQGAKYLIALQEEDGAWAKGADLSETCFALLFLKRATSLDTRVRGPLTGGGREVEVPKGATNDKTAAVQIATEGALPLEMKITGFGRAATKDLEWEGESGLGPHVARVEWIADDRILAVRLSDPSQPARGASFTARHLFAQTGTVELYARVHVVLPGGTDSKVIESPPLELEIETALPRWMSKLASEQGANPLREGKPGARGSSTLRKPEKLGLPKRKYEAALAIDGNPRTPWLASLKDDEPKLTVTLKKAQEADLVLISHAQLVPQAALTLPAALIVRINKGDEREIELSADPMERVRIELAETTRVKSVEVRLVGRQQGPNGPMGLGEIELRNGKP